MSSEVATVRKGIADRCPFVQNIPPMLMSYSSLFPPRDLDHYLDDTYIYLDVYVVFRGTRFPEPPFSPLESHRARRKNSELRPAPHRHGGAAEGPSRATPKKIGGGGPRDRPDLIRPGPGGPREGIR